MAWVADRRDLLPDELCAESSSINFSRSVRYGFGCLSTAMQFRLARLGLLRSKRFPSAGRPNRLRQGYGESPTVTKSDVGRGHPLGCPMNAQGVRTSFKVSQSM